MLHQNFVVPLALAALCLEMALWELKVAVLRALRSQRGPLAAGGHVSLAALALLALLPAWQGIGGRQTNMDFVARVINKEQANADVNSRALYQAVRRQLLGPHHSFACFQIQAEYRGPVQVAGLRTVSWHSLSTASR